MSVHDDRSQNQSQPSFDQIQQAIANSHYEQAAQLLAPRLEAPTPCARTWQYWVQLAYRQNDLVEASHRVVQAVSDHPYHRPIHELYGRIQKAQGNDVKARVIVDKALIQWPMAPDLLCLKLDLLRGSELKTVGLEFVSNTRKNTDPHPAIQMAIARWYQSYGRFDAAYSVVISLLTHQPTHTNAIALGKTLAVHIAQYAINKRQLEKADKVLTDAITYNIFNPVIWKLWVQVALELDLIELASERVTRAHTRRPNDPELQVLRVRILMALGEFSRALLLVEEELKKHHLHAGLCCAKLDLLRMINLKSPAFSLLRMLYDAKTVHPSVMLAIARFYQANNRIEAAISVLQALLAQHTDHLNGRKLWLSLIANFKKDEYPSHLINTYQVIKEKNNASQQDIQILLHAISLIDTTQAASQVRRNNYHSIIQFILGQIQYLNEKEKLKLLFNAEKLTVKKEVSLTCDAIFSHGPKDKDVILTLFQKTISSQVYHSLSALKERLTKHLTQKAKNDVNVEFTLCTDGPHAALSIYRSVRQSKRNLLEARRLCHLLKITHVHGLGQRYIRQCRLRWPQDFTLKSLHALMLLNSGQPQRALEILHGNIPVAKKIAAANLRAQCWLEIGDSQEAQKELDTSGVGNTVQLLMTRLRLLIMLGRSEEAHNLIEKARRSGIQHEVTSEHFSVSMIGVHLNDLCLYQAEKSALNLSHESADLVSRYNFAASKVVATHTIDTTSVSQTDGHRIPRRIVQYWDTPTPPQSITDTMATWENLADIEYERFDSRKARYFLKTTFGQSYEKAFLLANNPAEGADFFRLCYLRHYGGLYIDADDRFHANVDSLFPEGTDLLCFRENFGALANNVISATPQHPAIIYASEMALSSLLARDNESTWSKTGPGLLTRAIATYLITQGNQEQKSSLKIQPIYQLRRTVHIHMELPHKKTQSYWNANTINRFDIRKLIL
ncbi:glycosyltransferase [Cobetia sp. MC34]|uniref:glycosyltransferase n=1 Tax=Cobetia sp. MC34 TaxID=2785080 RepID=UPI001BC8E0F0|nr:glycosyltransferase [Cobetia sp. MC34]MBS4155352.1 hypothetical protein [Cobetia sp. MC34]